MRRERSGAHIDDQRTTHGRPFPSAAVPHPAARLGGVALASLLAIVTPAGTQVALP